MVVIARPRKIGREWRLIVAGDRVLTGSQYANRGEREIAAELPDGVRHFAEEMLSRVRWTPDPIFMIDVCESNDRLRLVELNSFSGSWIYQCDLTVVVSAAAELAKQAAEGESRQGRQGRQDQEKAEG